MPPPWGEGFGIPENFIRKILMIVFKVCRLFGVLVMCKRVRLRDKIAENKIYVL